MINFSKNIWTIVAAGDFFQAKFLELYRDRHSTIVAVDRGLQYLKTCEILPDFCIGDFDSLGYVPQTGDVRVYPTDKDCSDMELALKLSTKNDAQHINVFGAMGGARPEHSIANLHIFSKYPRLVTIYDKRATYVFADNGNPVKIPSRNAKSGYVSIFPFAGLCEGVCATGLKYQLDDARLEPGSSQALSNEFIGKNVEISVNNGTLLIVIMSS
ncbi:MAG: thiamine diphosphokinase [Eggerthellaceae bacterium]|nr:thiamine diphosphokinase [Eggerthellaceae bacterium]